MERIGATVAAKCKTALTLGCYTLAPGSICARIECQRGPNRMCVLTIKNEYEVPQRRVAATVLVWLGCVSGLAQAQTAG
jgi:hypothetical protein